MTPQEIISDDEIARVHGNANFGAMDPREVVNDGVRKTAVGYHCGSTQLHILRDHGLVTKPRPGSSDADLTKKGKAYARSIYRDTTPARAEAQDEGAAGEKNLGWFAGFARKHGHHAQADWLDNYARAHPSPTPAADADRVRVAVERGLKHFDATSAMCPFNKSPSPPKEKPCPICKAEKSEGCRREITGAFGFVSEVREALKSTAAKEGGEV